MALEGLKNAYFKAEDKWYAATERIGLSGLADRIDKAVPSFALFLFIIVVLLIAAFFLLPGMLPSGAVFSFKAVDEDGAAISNVTVTVLAADGTQLASEKTGPSGETKQITLPIGKEIEISAIKEGFEEFRKTLTASKSMLPYEITLISEEEKTYTISLKDSLGQPIREPVTLTFHCRNSAIQPWSETVSSGSTTVTLPANCNGLIASVQSAGFQPVESVSITQQNQSIFLQETIGGKATINVELLFNNQMASEAITVYLFKDNGTDAGIGPIETAVGENGRAVFLVDAGKYFVKSSSYGSFAATKSQAFTIAAGGQQTVQLPLQKNIVGTIRLSIIDEKTGKAVGDATVFLRLGSEEIDSKKTSLDNNALVEFPVTEDTAYTAVVDHSKYCLKVLYDVKVEGITRQVKLLPFTAECGGTLRAKVLDQDGKLVRGATVGLYTEDGFSAGFTTKTTDLNGIASFERVPSGTYKAFAFKAASTGWSDPANFVQRTAEKTILTVVLNVANGTVRVNVVDDEGMPLQHAMVAFVDATTNEVIGGGPKPVEDVNGIVELLTRADKRVYIVATKDGYANFTSIAKPVLPEGTQQFTAVLPKEIIQGEAQILFKGIFKNGKSISVLGPGEKYYALFNLRIPAKKNYDEIGMHVRTGTHNIMELDKIVLKEINTGGKTAITMATTYSQTDGYEIDSQHLSTDEGKWANIEWLENTTGIIEVAATVRVKETATSEDELLLFYRAWGVENGAYKRDPLDNDLGEAESIAGKDALYANAKQNTFQVGAESQCDELFCVSANILDVAENITTSATDSFNAKAFKAYKLGFTILNNSKHETDTYPDAELKIANEDALLLMQGYKIYGAQSQMVEGMAEGASTEWVEVGNILLNNTVNGTLNFTPQKSGSALLSIQIRSGNMVRFDKKIAINVAAEKEMNVVIAPETLPSGMETDLTVTAKDKKTGAEINEALVKVRDRFGTIVAEKFTNRMGIAVLRLPQLQPGETVQMIVGKPNYVTFEKALQVDSKVIAVKPATIGVALNPKTKVEADSAFGIENKTAFDLQIRGIRLSGKTYGLIDAEKVNNWLYGYINETIKSNEIHDMHLKTMLSEKGKKTSQAQQMEATLDITVAAASSEWEQRVPVKISIGLGGETDDPSCFTVTRKEWKGSTEGNPIEIEFELQNNCSIEGAQVELKNISGRIEWHSNHVGTFSVRTENSAMEIRSGYNRQFIATIEKEQSISVVLQFTPDAGVNGKGAADIIFQAENPTDTTTQVLADKIAAEITVVNLVDCIAFSKDVIVIKPEKSDSFDIETINCGPVNEIRLESDLTVSTANFKLGSKESKKIEVLAEKNIPGQYPIKVLAKGTDQVQFKLIKTIRARILSDKCIELSRYEFDVFDNPDNPYDGYDTADLINNCYNKQLQITVKYDEKDLMEAMKTGALVGLGMGLLGGLLGNQQQGTSEWTAASATGAAAGNSLTVNLSDGRTVTGTLSQDGTRLLDNAGNAIATRTPQQQSGIGGSLNPLNWFTPNQGSWNPAGAAGTASAGGLSAEQVAADVISSWYKGTQPQSQMITAEGAVLVYPTETIKITKINNSWNIAREPRSVATAPAAIAASPTGFALFGGDGGGLGGGLLGNLVMGAGSAILGKPSFAGWGLQGFLIGTLMAFNNQESGTFTFPTIQKDVVFKGIQLLMPGATLEDNKLVETPSTDIIARDVLETSTEPKPEDKRLSTEIRKIGFLNTTGAVQPDPATPLFRVLKVDAERLEYKTEYDTKENEHPDIKVKERKENKERFRLQFNSFNPLLVEPALRPIPNCKLGTAVGVTGPSAVPKVSFNWDWSSIAEDACVEGNPNYVYCDATQFSIVVLKKLQRLQQFIEEQKPFDCPTAATAGAVKEQPLLGTAYDVAITKVQANKVGTKDANIVVSIESNNGVRMNAELRIDLSNAATGELAKSCTKVLSVLSKTIENCEFKNLGEGLYNVRASVSATLCQTCENSSPENNSIEAVLAIGSAGVAECDPFNTKRLPLFIEATEASGNAGWSAQQREQILKTIKFNAYLMQDAFTGDFRKDFDLFCKQQSFFDCPPYYYEASHPEDGLHRFFSDQDRFRFDYSMAPHAPADAGKYTVTINIEFDNKNWDLFSANEPSARISIEMAKLSTPEPDSPFYYLPFDGLIGVDSMDGRQGYGVNFRQTSEETVTIKKIKVNNSQEQPIVSSNIASSTPVLNGWIEAGINDSFRRLNLDARGILLDVRAATDSTRVTLSPSYATPVIMQVDYEKGEHAYGFYSIEVDTPEPIPGKETIGGSPQTAFSKMIAWSGIGAACRDFGDRPVMEAWQDTWDEHGGITANQQCAIGTDITDYGIEWCNPIRKGSVFLEGVIFTPQNSTSLMKRATYSDNMQLISVGNKGSQIALNGVPAMEFNSYGANSIDSLEDVLELVKQNKVCLIGQGNRISAQFFWNPKAVLEELAAERDRAAEKCIKIKQ